MSLLTLSSSDISSFFLPPLLPPPFFPLFFPILSHSSSSSLPFFLRLSHPRPFASSLAHCDHLHRRGSELRLDEIPGWRLPSTCPARRSMISLFTRGQDSCYLWTCYRHPGCGISGMKEHLATALTCNIPS